MDRTLGVLGSHRPGLDVWRPGIRGTIIALALWVTAYITLPFLPYGAALFPSFIAVLDIALVLVVFRGDVDIT